MTIKEREFRTIRKEYIERKIYLKRQLIEITNKEIAALEVELEKPCAQNSTKESEHNARLQSY